MWGHRSVKTKRYQTNAAKIIQAHRHVRIAQERHTVIPSLFRQNVCPAPGQLCLLLYKRIKPIIRSH